DGQAFAPDAHREGQDTFGNIAPPPQIDALRQVFDIAHAVQIEEVYPARDTSAAADFAHHHRSQPTRQMLGVLGRKAIDGCAFDFITRCAGARITEAAIVADFDHCAAVGGDIVEAVDQ